MSFSWILLPLAPLSRPPFLCHFFLLTFPLLTSVDIFPPWHQLLVKSLFPDITCSWNIFLLTSSSLVTSSSLYLCLLEFHSLDIPVSWHLLTSPHRLLLGSLSLDTPWSWPFLLLAHLVLHNPSHLFLLTSLSTSPISSLVLMSFSHEFSSSWPGLPLISLFLGSSFSWLSLGVSLPLYYMFPKISSVCIASCCEASKTAFQLFHKACSCGHFAELFCTTK